MLKNVTEAVKEVSDKVSEAVHDSFFSNKEAPLAPLSVPELPEVLPEIPEVVEQSGVLFSDVSLVDAKLQFLW